MKLTKETRLVVPKGADKKTVEKICAGLFGFSPAAEEGTKETVCRIGNAPACPEKKAGEYAFRIAKDGACVTGKDKNSALRGLFALFLQGEAKGDCAVFPEGERESRFVTENRFLHVCVFPETDKTRLLRFVRAAGLLQFTHVIVEFWGTFPFACLDELSWKEYRWTPDEVKNLVSEIRAFGMEPVPMFNLFGHAAQARNRAGKHVVLDQNPALRDLFTPDGWVWNHSNPRVPELLRQVRKELYAAFGAGEYFHAGFDEAYFVSHTPEKRKELPRVLGGLTREIVAEGRRPMLWMDMFLPKESFSAFTATGNEAELGAIFQAIPKEAVCCDWQYRTDTNPVPTSLYLKEKGLNVMLCSWLDRKNVTACVKTAAENGLSGYMCTTWHTLEKDPDGLSHAALELGAVLFPWAERTTRFLLLSTLLRAVSFEKTDYALSGFAPRQFEPLPR